MSGSHLWVLPFILFLIMSHRHMGSWVCGLAEFLNLELRVGSPGSQFVALDIHFQDNY